MKSSIRNISHGEVNMKADTYFNDPEKVKEWEDMGFEVHAVDPFGGVVAKDKDLSNKGLQETQESIRRRFDLGCD